MILPIVALVAYGDLLDRFFAFDDFAVLAQTEHVRTLSDVSSVFVPWPSFAQYRPLTTTGYFALARHLFGLDPRPWMAVQLAAYVVNALLVMAIARRLLGTSAAGLAAALVYASAPGHALTVRWIAFATIWGTALAYFLGLWTWLRAERWRMPATLGWLVLGLLCSEHAVSFPATVTAVAVLGQGRRDWRALACETGPLWTLALLYVAAKLVYLYVLLPSRDPMGAGVFLHAYAVSFDGRALLETLGAYVGAAFGPLYQPERSSTWRAVAGAVVLASIVTALMAAFWTNRRWIGVMACGLVVFVTGLGPIILLPAHVYPAYIGIAGLGVALAFVAPVSALPRGDAASLVLAGMLVAVHLVSTAATSRRQEDFLLIERTSVSAARWLARLDRAADSETIEVVVPRDPNTNRLFGAAHRLFLCASYAVRPVPDVAKVPPAPGRVVLRDGWGPMPPADGGWRAIRRECPEE